LRREQGRDGYREVVEENTSADEMAEWIKQTPNGINKMRRQCNPAEEQVAKGCHRFRRRSRSIALIIARSLWISSRSTNCQGVTRS
jgi:hypothetical protein